MCNHFLAKKSQPQIVENAEDYKGHTKTFLVYRFFGLVFLAQARNL